MQIESFACIEVELKATKKVLKILNNIGIDWLAIGKPKIVYTSKKIYTRDEIEFIYSGNWELIKMSPFDQKHIEKLRPSATQLLTGEDKIEVGLMMEEYIRKPLSKVVRAQVEGLRNYSVYVFRLKDKACKYNKLIDANQPTKGRVNEAFYVGQTVISIQERFAIHTNKEHPNHAKGSSVMKKFAFSNHFEECNFTTAFELTSPIKVSGLTYYESLYNERAMALFIRDEFI